MLSKLRTAIKRLLTAKPRELLRAIAPTRISQLLYERSAGDTFVPPISDLELDCERYYLEKESAFEAVNQRITRSRDVYAATVEGKLAHRSTLFLDVLLPQQFGFSPDIPVIGACWTAPEFRGHRVYPHVLSHIARDATQRLNVDRVYILVSPENKPSIKGIEHAGYRPVAKLSAIRVLGFVFSKRVITGIGF